MNLSGISSFAVSERRLERNIKDTMTDITASSEQVSSEKKYQSFHEMDVDKIQITSELESSILGKEKMVKLNGSLKSKLSEYENSMRVMQNTLSKALQFSQNVNNPVTRQSISITEISHAYILELKTTLSTTYQGQYLYSGSKVDVAPIGNIESVSNLNEDGSYNNIYYKGNDIPQTQQVTEGINLAFGYNAGDETFQKFFGALHLLKRYESTNNANDIKRASELLSEVKTELSEKLSVLGNQSLQVENQIEFDETHTLALKGFYKEIIEVDFLSATTNFHQKSTKLQALYMIMQASNKMSYVDYMR